MQIDDCLAGRGEGARRVPDETLLDNVPDLAWEWHGCRAGGLDTCMDPRGSQ